MTVGKASSGKNGGVGTYGSRRDSVTGIASSRTSASPRKSLSSNHLAVKGEDPMLNQDLDGDEDGDNRTRNAKAQRRHREKRKAHVKQLEDTVQLLTFQLDEARRQLAQPFAGPSRIPPSLSPKPEDYSQLQAENVYLRDENNDLRRQLYAYSASFGNLASRPPGAGLSTVEPGKEVWGAVKAEPGGQFGGSYHQSSISPARAGSGQDRVRHPGELVDNGSTGGGSSSAPSSAASYPNAMDHFARIEAGRTPRTRVLSASSAPAASPYLPSPTSFPSDPRAHSLTHTPAQPSPGIEPRFPHVRYEPHMFSTQSHPHQPPPHAMPRSALAYDMGHRQAYPPRPEGEVNSMPWGPDSGPPPFPGPVAYQFGMSAEAHDGQQEWKQGH